MPLRGPTISLFGILLALCGFAGAAKSTSVPPKYREYRSRPDLKPPGIRILKRSSRTNPGYIFIAPKKEVAQGGPLILDNRGQVVWFLPIESPGITDFRVQRYLDRPVLTWWRGRSEDGDDVGRYFIYDSSYRLVKHIRPGNELTGDMHEFLVTPRNTALMTLSHRVNVKGRSILEGAFQEVDLETGRVLFEWHSIDHVRLVESYYRLPRNHDRAFDYFHMNSIEIDDDGDLLVSARNTHTVYKISRRTGKILWRLGGKRSNFTLGRGVRFGWQHDARRQPDGTLTLFDNAAAPKLRKQSRGLVLRLDMNRMRADVVRTFVHRPPIVAVDQGNMQRLPNGHYLVGWGHQPYFTEFGRRGTIAFDGRFGRGRVDSYRAYRFPWIGRPRYRPAIAVAGDSLFASWNGATDVGGWQLLGGKKRNALTPLRVVRRTGFETKIALPRDVEFVAVRALDAKNRSMARSKTLPRG
jgi:arylsulfotransferase ASST